MALPTRTSPVHHMACLVACDGDRLSIMGKRRGPVGLLYGENVAKHTYVGPTTFRGKCSTCGEPRNRHCGRCKACPGFHVGECMTGYATGASH